VKHDDSNLPVWHEASGNYLDPATGEILPSCDEALDAIGDHDEPLHVARFGQRFDAQGVLSGSRDASRCIGYLTKYLTKHVSDCHQAQTGAQHAHTERLADALRYEPCSPTCANWLRYGVQPKNLRAGLRPGRCKGKAHRREHLGYAGRRVLVSRKWSGKTLADHRADRRDWLLATLGLPATDPARYTWEPVTPRRPGPHDAWPERVPQSTSLSGCQSAVPGSDLRYLTRQSVWRGPCSCPALTRAAPACPRASVGASRRASGCARGLASSGRPSRRGSSSWAYARSSRPPDQTPSIPEPETPPEALAS
jgi:hypothetical protein